MPGAILYPEVLRQFEEAFHEQVIIVPYSERKAAILPESRIQDMWVQKKNPGVYGGYGRAVILSGRFIRMRKFTGSRVV